MAAGAASGGSATTDTYKEARTWLLMPAWVTLSILVLAPVGLMLIYSFLTKEFRGGVIWEPSLAAYDQFFFDRGLFGDDPATINWTYISIFWRSIWQAGAATLLSLAIGFPTAFYNFTHPTAAALAEKIAQLAPGHLNAVHFGNSGSVANDTAIRMLHHYNIRKGRPEKKIVLSRQGAYHGSTHLAMAMTQPAYSEGWHCASDIVHHLRSPHYWREGADMTEAEFLDALIDDLKSNIERIGAENICAFIAEPIQRAGGVINAPKGYHRRAWEICQANDIKYVADEVVTAFGRLGHFFASEDVFDMVPDIITTATGLTSGYQPLSATIISDEIQDVITGPDGIFLHGMTYSGHPAAAAAALKNIEIMERDQIPQRVLTTGARFEAHLRSLTDIEIVGEVRGSHFMMGIEFVKDRATKESHPMKAQVGLKVAQACQKRGLIARPLGNVLILSPTLIMDNTMIDQIEGILREAINEVAAGL